MFKTGVGTKIYSPQKTFKRAKYATTDMDDFDAEKVRRTVHEFYDNREYPKTEKFLVLIQKKQAMLDLESQCGEF